MRHQNETGLLSKELIAGRDYPDTYREFVTMFPDNEACAQYLQKLRWPDSFICPACGIKQETWVQTRNRMVCPSCRRQTSITARTIFDKTRTPLTTWFEAAWHMTTAKNGISEKTLKRTLGTSYRVAWVMLQRYRVAMVRANRSLLAGTVEVDETFVGGVTQNEKRGRGTHKCIVVIAVEIKDPKGYGRIQMQYIPDASGNSLIPFVRDKVKPGTIICTDGWGGYNNLSKYEYKHKRVILSDSGDPAHVSMPGVHRIASLFKRWMLGTHQGSCDPEHLQSYLEEFTFRFNRRTSKSRGLVFHRLLEQAVVTNPVTDKEVTHGYSWLPNKRS